ncbi:MAG: protein-L-isoaspartate O-methyltransferase family protein [Nocardioidaceae bacterium]
MRDRRVIAAMRRQPRAAFLPSDLVGLAEQDRPIPIGGGQTNSQPTTVAMMLSWLQVRQGDRVLDVGAGSGWTTALLAELVGPTGSVCGVELDPQLAEWGSANVAARGVPWAVVRRSEPGQLGWPDTPPYDRILVSAGTHEVPHELIDQLASGGTMVIPVSGQMFVVRKQTDGTVDLQRHGSFRFVPLVR